MKKNIVSIITLVLVLLLFLGILGSMKDVFNEFTKCDECSFDGGVITTQPTCYSPGSIKFTCDKCGNVETETIEIVSCDFSNILEEKEPTCFESGYKICKCSYCNKTVSLSHKQLEHTYKFIDNLFICIYCNDTHEELSNGSLIAFTVLKSNQYGVDFLAEYGMTFKTWIDSKYCIYKSRFTIKDGLVYYYESVIGSSDDIIQPIIY